MPSRSRFYPPDDVTAGEWRYLLERYGYTADRVGQIVPSQEAKDQRARVALTLKRLVGNGYNAKQLHDALLVGIRGSMANTEKQVDRKRATQWKAKVTRAEKDIARALASLRILLPPRIRLDDDDLFAMRDLLLGPKQAPPRPIPARATSRGLEAGH